MALSIGQRDQDIEGVPRQGNVIVWFWTFTAEARHRPILPNFAIAHNGIIVFTMRESAPAGNGGTRIEWQRDGPGNAGAPRGVKNNRRMTSPADPVLRRERWKLTARLVRSLELPMLLLSGVWSLLLVLEFTRGLSPWLQSLSDLIWAAFVLQFGLEFAAAPAKRLYVRKRWITVLSLALPAFRLLRLVRVARAARLARAARGLRLARLLGAINRVMRSLATGFKQRGLGYLIVLTALIAVTGAAGMYRFELDAPGGPGFADYGTALWWTAMLLTTMGSEYWPRTPEGRLLCVLLATYAFAVFGYVTAAIAAYFVGKDVRLAR